MDTTLRKAEKAFAEEGSPEAAERLTAELQRSGKTAGETAEQLIEATAKAIKNLILERFKIKKVVLPPTSVLIVDEKLLVLADYGGHAEQRPLLLFEGWDSEVGLTEAGIFKFVIGWTQLAKTDKKIDRISGIRLPKWDSRVEEDELYISFGLRALRYLG